MFSRDTIFRQVGSYAGIEFFYYYYSVLPVDGFNTPLSIKTKNDKTTITLYVHAFFSQVTIHTYVYTTIVLCIYYCKFINAHNASQSCAHLPITIKNTVCPHLIVQQFSFPTQVSHAYVIHYRIFLYRRAGVVKVFFRIIFSLKHYCTRMEFFEFNNIYAFDITSTLHFSILILRSLRKYYTYEPRGTAAMNHCRTFTFSQFANKMIIVFLYRSVVMFFFFFFFLYES